MCFPAKKIAISARKKVGGQLSTISPGPATLGSKQDSSRKNWPTFFGNNGEITSARYDLKKAFKNAPSSYDDDNDAEMMQSLLTVAPVKKFMVNWTTTTRERGNQILPSLPV